MNNGGDLTLQEKTLYHQIHPLKLATDIGVTFPSLYLFWQHQPAAALIVAFAPAIIVSALLIRFADLRRYKHSAFGRYCARHMDSPAVSALRLGGFAVTAIGAWFQRLWPIALGLAIVLAAWLRGLIFPGKEMEA